VRQKGGGGRRSGIVAHCAARSSQSIDPDFLEKMLPSHPTTAPPKPSRDRTVIAPSHQIS
jgi:hypothetical protein